MPRPDICLIDNQRCPNEWRTLPFVQDTAGAVDVALRDRNGDPYDLTNKMVRFIAKEWPTFNALYIDTMAVVVNAEEGIVRLSLTEVDLCNAGMFLGEFILYWDVPESSGSSSSGSESSSSAEPAPAYISGSLARIQCYLEVRETLERLDSGPNSPLTIAEVRLAIRDKCREDNFLLDNVEFTDTEIAWAIRRPIEYWNEVPPPLRPGYTVGTFPYRYYWLYGIIGELLSIATTGLARNTQVYSAAGLSFDEKARVTLYRDAADKYLKEYREWVRVQKRALNLSMAYGSVSIPSFGNKFNGT